jgi:hypothetical protein
MCQSITVGSKHADWESKVLNNSLVGLLTTHLETMLEERVLGEVLC